LRRPDNRSRILQTGRTCRRGAPAPLRHVQPRVV